VPGPEEKLKLKFALDTLDHPDPFATQAGLLVALFTCLIQVSHLSCAGGSAGQCQIGNQLDSETLCSGCNAPERSNHGRLGKSSRWAQVRWTM
jgi:hypothetical protein